MTKNKKFFKTILSWLTMLIVGGIVGGLVGRYLGQRLSQGEGWLFLISLIPSLVLQVAIHEAGHLVGGLLSGYRFVSYRLFNLVLQQSQGRLQLRFFSIPGTLG